MRKGYAGVTSGEPYCVPIDFDLDHDRHEYHKLSPLRRPTRTGIVRLIADPTELSTRRDQALKLVPFQAV